ncbi:hypothetical protein [Paraburkholderia lycopersici]|uniref:hypothetical protein n=1 Tax=Paraburkholderia lycopersici TaxID=416944 RepID=UPI0015A1A460|nr:hypothetical protein [Paraburkholderia lycopersici]
MLLDGTSPQWREADVPDPVPAAGERFIGGQVCSVCRAGLYVVDDGLTQPERCP